MWVCVCCACVFSGWVFVCGESSARAGYTIFYHLACHTNTAEHTPTRKMRTNVGWMRKKGGSAHNKSTNTDARQQTQIAYIKHLHMHSHTCGCVCVLANDDLYVQFTTEVLWSFPFISSFWLLLLLSLLISSSAQIFLLFWCPLFGLFTLFSAAAREEAENTQNHK